jgi:hypothetical protein
MEYNECGTCEAGGGRAGMLINGDCLNCHNTRKSGNIVFDADLLRTEQELQRTTEILHKD